MTVTEARLRDGDILRVGDEVETNFHHTCEAKTFVIYEMSSYQYCESGTLVLAHLKNYPDRILRGSHGEGLDANWFKKKIKQ